LLKLNFLLATILTSELRPVRLFRSLLIHVVCFGGFFRFASDIQLTSYWHILKIGHGLYRMIFMDLIRWLRSNCRIIKDSTFKSWIWCLFSVLKNLSLINQLLLIIIVLTMMLWWRIVSTLQLSLMFLNHKCFYDWAHAGSIQSNPSALKESSICHERCKELSLILVSPTIILRSVHSLYNWPIFHR